MRQGKECPGPVQYECNQVWKWAGNLNLNWEFNAFVVTVCRGLCNGELSKKKNFLNLQLELSLAVSYIYTYT